MCRRRFCASETDSDNRSHALEIDVGLERGEKALGDPIEGRNWRGQSEIQQEGERLMQNGWRKKLNSNPEEIANALGWFSIGLGLAEVLAPRVLSKLIGVKPNTG